MIDRSRRLGGGLLPRLRRATEPIQREIVPEPEPDKFPPEIKPEPIQREIVPEAEWRAEKERERQQKEFDKALEEHSQKYNELQETLNQRQKEHQKSIEEMRKSHENRLEEMTKQFASSRNPITPEMTRPKVRLGDSRSLRKFMLS